MSNKSWTRLLALDEVLWTRIAALLIDVLAAALAAGVPALVLAWSLARLGGVGGWAGSAVLAAGWTAFVVYLLARDALPHGSFGKRVMGLAVLRHDRPHCPLAASIVRNLTLFVPVINVIEIALVLTERTHRRLGDRLAATRVVEV